MRVKCLDQEYNTMSPTWARTRTARSWDEQTSHEAAAPPTPYPPVDPLFYIEFVEIAGKRIDLKGFRKARK